MEGGVDEVGYVPDTLAFSSNGALDTLAASRSTLSGLVWDNVYA